MGKSAQILPTNDLTGKRIGTRIVVRFAGRTKNHIDLWLLRCDCGDEKSVRGTHLRAGQSKTCKTCFVKPQPLMRLWNRINKLENGCWEYTGAIGPNGYGYLQHNGNAYPAHRVAWMLTHNKDIPSGMYICHKCDHRKCVNPDHLFLGTPSDNMQDASSKGRVRNNQELSWKTRRERYGPSGREF